MILQDLQHHLPKGQSHQASNPSRFLVKKIHMSSFKTCPHVADVGEKKPEFKKKLGEIFPSQTTMYPVISSEVRYCKVLVSSFPSHLS